LLYTNVIISDLPLDPSPGHGRWSSGDVPLSEGPGWKKLAGGQRIQASRGDFQTVLSRLEALEIRAGGGDAMAPVFLDNVAINQPVWASAPGK